MHYQASPSFRLCLTKAVISSPRLTWHSRDLTRPTGQRLAVQRPFLFGFVLPKPSLPRLAEPRRALPNPDLPSLPRLATPSLFSALSYQSRHYLALPGRATPRLAPTCKTLPRADGFTLSAQLLTSPRLAGTSYCLTQPSTAPTRHDVK